MSHQNTLPTRGIAWRWKQTHVRDARTRALVGGPHGRDAGARLLHLENMQEALPAGFTLLHAGQTQEHMGTA